MARTLRQRLSKTFDLLREDMGTEPRQASVTTWETRTLRSVTQSGSSGGGRTIQGEGEAIAELRAVPVFHRIRSSLMSDLIITTGEDLTVEVRAQPNLIKYLETVVENDELVLRMNCPKGYTTTKLMQVRVQMPLLTSIHTTGHGNIRASDVHADDFRIQSSGHGDVDVEGKFKTLTLTSTGHGDLTLSGESNQVSVTHSGHGDLNLRGLNAVDITLNSSGMGDVEVCFTGSAQGQATGHGDILVTGNPGNWHVKRSGFGKVRFS